ncbi:PQQ-binding-like beta-propeller repeat protein [uncultured Friedmanniella sp.]|uniref:outer membrane protein assembly factor BamB family protein n=1 Tax=uncultured Friedmanniella sp. TaxID=335381 RepID=UPI0035CC216E
MVSSGAAVPRRTSWVVAFVVPALLVWFGAAVHRPLQAAEPVRSTAASFLPADATRQSVEVTQQGRTTPAMEESARFSGSVITSAMSPAAFTSLDPPAEGLAAASWWREALVPAGVDSPSRYRIRSVGTDGVWLKVQDWEDLGISFQRFLELPADVAVGRTWSSAGSAVARPVTRQLTYRNTSRAVAPSDPGRASQGCLQVESTTSLTGGKMPEAWNETNLWCPGLGVVDSRGSFRGEAYVVAPAGSSPAVTDLDLRQPALDLSGLDRWTVRPEKLLAGDATFGGDTATVFTGTRPVVAANGEISYAPYGAGDLSGLTPLGPGNLWAHWWARPGGAVVAVTSIGSLVLVTTTDRRLTAYGAGGSFRWSVALDDVAVVAPVVAGRDRVAVGTVSGEVAVFDLRSGVRLWRDQLAHGVHQALAADGSVLVAVDAGPTLTAWDLGTGRRRWQFDAPSVYVTGLVVGSGAVVLGTNGSLLAYDPATGRRRWERPVGFGLSGVVAASGQVWVEVGDALQARSTTSGDVLWSLPGTSAAATDCTAAGPDSATAFAFSGTDLVALDDAGTVRDRWPLRAPATDVRVAGCGLGRVWVTSYAADDATLQVESVGPS